jgi:hypothetical protein
MEAPQRQRRDIPRSGRCCTNPVAEIATPLTAHSVMHPSLPIRIHDRTVRPEPTTSQIHSRGGANARAVRHQAASRAARPWLAMVAVPLGVTALGALASINSPLLVGILVLSGAAWWWSPREHRWTWLLVIQSGLVGAEWAYDGATALSEWPSDRVVVDLGWCGFAVALAACSLFVRLRERTPGY